MEETAEKEIERLRRRVERERGARLEAEALAEGGIRQIYDRQRQLELLQVITDAANSAQSPESCLQVTLREWCAYTAWPIGHAYLVAQDPLRLVSSRLWNIDQPQAFDRFREVTEQMVMDPGFGLPGRIQQSGRSEWIVDV